MEFTGERYVPALKGQIYYEHLHRYAIAARFCAGKRVLDIASGEGYGAALLARAAGEVIGVDIDAASVEHARRTYYAANLRFLLGSCTEIPLADRCVDVVASFETIEHVGEHERMLDEMKRVLAPDGVLVLSSPNKLVYSDAPQFNNPFHVRELYFAELRDLLARRFRHVALYGQRLSASSVVHPLAGAVSEAASWYNGNAEHVAPGLPALKDPVYFVAVCSDEPLAGDVSSAYVDPSDDLLADIWLELNMMRRQALAALGDGEAPALPAAADGAASLPAPEPVAAPAAEAEAAQAAHDAQAALHDAQAALHDAQAALRDAHASELAELRAHHEAEMTALGGTFEAQAARLAAAHDSERAVLQERLALESETLRALRRETDDARFELRRARDAAAAAAAALHEERSRGERLMQQVTELRTASERAQQALDALEDERRARAHAESAYAALREQVVALTEALQFADADSRALREVLSSRSWKLTAPLRRAASVVRR